MHPAVAALLAAMHAHVNTQPTIAGGSGDAQIAGMAAAHLSHAAAIAQDPELRAHLAAAHATLVKHTATLHKEHSQALAGKFSPRQMASAKS